MTSVGPAVVDATAADLIALRRRVLRDGRSELHAEHPADDLPTTRHLAVLDAAIGEVVGGVTLVRESRAFDGVEARVHLVLMAVAPERQGQGIGAELVRAAQRVASEDRDAIWAAARTSALGFYERLGFRASGEEFVGAMDLPHRCVVWP